MSLRQLRSQQQDASQVREEVAFAAESIKGGVLHDSADNAVSGADGEEGTAAAEVALEGSADNGHGHHHHGHHTAENQLRWAADSDYCMSVDGNAFANGQKVQIWKCMAGMGQYFHYDPTGRTTLLRSAAAPAFCVVVDGNNFHNGAKVQLWQCESHVKAQHWIMETGGGRKVMLRNAAFPSKCLVVNGNDGYNGNKLQLWDCQGSEQLKLWKPAH